MKHQQNTVLPDEMEEAAPGIFYTRRPLVAVGSEAIDCLKQSARSNDKKRARLCAHPSPESAQHDMLIVSHRDTYVAPHRHLKKTESFLVLEGRALILLFDDKGQLQNSFEMCPFGSQDPFFYRMPVGQFHSLKVISELLVFVESTKGPFQKHDSQDAAWAPAADELGKGRAYIDGLIDEA